MTSRAEDLVQDRPERLMANQHFCHNCSTPTSEDASLILQYVANVIDSLPCQGNMTGLTPDQLQDMINMMDEIVNNNF